MRKTKLMVTHPEVTDETLGEYVSGRGPVCMGLRIAVLQGVMDSAPIDQLSRRHRMSRQGIYDLVKRVNEKGIEGVEEEKHPGRPGSLTDEIAKDLKEKLIEPPMNQGYRQSRWDGPLVRKYLKEKHDIDIGRSQMINWLHTIKFSVQRERKKYSRADPGKQDAFVDAFKKNFKIYTLMKQAFSWIRPLLPNGRRKDARVQKIPKGNAESFIAFLQWVTDSYPKHSRIQLFVDNSRWHKAQTVTKYLPHQETIVLNFFPSYSPELNPMEWEWHELRGEATHTRRFQSSAECWQTLQQHFETRKGKNKHFLCPLN